MTSRLAATVSVSALTLAAALAGIYLNPPDILRVGANYSAKIVCSNVFLAKRDASAVLLDDVQNPGVSAMRALKVRVDAEQGTVRSDFLGLFGRGLAVYRPGTGCATVPDGNLDQARKHSIDVPAAAALPADVDWPQGERAQLDEKVQALLADDTLAGPGMRAIAVIHKGKLVGERYATGFAARTPLLGWSMTKTVTAALVGMNVLDGKLKLDQQGFWPVAENDLRSTIKLSDLMAMSSGLRFDEGYGSVSDVTRMLYLVPDTSGYAHSQPLVHPIGSVFSYASGTTAILSGIWQQATGAQSLRYPYERLFGPLGMRSATMEADARGNYVGSSYMYATARDWARFGQFLLQDGLWNGQRLLPEGFVTTMRAHAPASKGEYGGGQLWRRGARGTTPEGTNPDKAFGLPDDIFYMSGHDAQTVSIMPSKGLVVVRLGLTPSSLRYQQQGLLAALIKQLDR